jgi:hypothetical protein
VRACCGTIGGRIVTIDGEAAIVGADGIAELLAHAPVGLIFNERTTEYGAAACRGRQLRLLQSAPQR